MKKTTSKRELRQEIEEQVESYLQQGGHVDQIPRGISGRDPADGPLRPVSEFTGEPRSERTPLNDVVAAIEARRRSRKTAPGARHGKKPRKKIIYDDFGEPLRWEWDEG